MRQWPTILIDAGDQIAADCIFGPATERATRAFQVALGVTADGIFGPQTREATARLLAWLVASAAPPSSSVPPFPGTV